MRQPLSFTAQASLVMFSMVIFSAAGAVVSGFMAQEDQTLALLGKSNPQKIRAEDLGQKGPGDNIHVALTQFELGRNIVTVRQRNADGWEAVYVPVYPKGQAATDKPFKVAIKSTHVRGPESMEELAQKSMIEGLVINAVPGQGTGLAAFKEKYPDIDLKSVWLIDEGRDIPTFATIDRKNMFCSIFVGVGVVCLFGSIAMAFAAKREGQPIY